MPYQWWECGTKKCNKKRKWSIAKRPGCRNCGRKKNMEIMEPQPPPPKDFFKQDRIEAADRVLKGWVDTFKSRSK